ncbi:TATDN1 isoform 1 [Pan troglodytes]|uniref:TatD DNase domain containing 1 n=3 Tax=Hominidae TaxID=9604 RepID=E5RJY6_HUMAN|nr:TatD DNase domain containing 1 [Homo sapiens]KAI4011884.1 TatD DNase domain containing 1 [Homo sapiens]PNI85628.1 TATDN1 isoform 1 [Pan troglodytes]PNJ76278.1 TATDN1 isoform 10 [Pongo abelii]
MSRFKFIDDLQDVIGRAVEIGVKKFMITGGNLQDSKDALHLAQTNDILKNSLNCQNKQNYQCFFIVETHMLNFWT